MSLHRSCVALAIVIALAGCATRSTSLVSSEEPAGSALPAESRELIVNIAPHRAPCTGVAPTLCLQVRTRPGAPWQLHHGEIEGFDWQSGVEYVIRVREVAVARPPADAPSLRWVLEEILERDPPR